jgi:glutaredoxin
VPRARFVIAVTLYSRPGCHLCDDMKAVVARAIAGRVDVALEEVDISSDPALEARYGLKIPVLLVDGRKVAKYRVDEGVVRRALDERSA